LLYLGDHDNRATAEQQLEFYTDALFLADKSGSPSLLLRCYLALSRYYRRNHHLANAAAFVQRALSLIMQYSRNEDLATMLVESSRVCIDSAQQSSSKNEADGWYRQALDQLSQADLALQQTSFTSLTGEVLMLLAQVQETLGRHQDALVTYTRLQPATQHQA